MTHYHDSSLYYDSLFSVFSALIGDCCREKQKFEKWKMKIHFQSKRNIQTRYYPYHSKGWVIYFTNLYDSLNDSFRFMTIRKMTQTRFTLLIWTKLIEQFQKQSNQFLTDIFKDYKIIENSSTGIIYYIWVIIIIIIWLIWLWLIIK